MSDEERRKAMARHPSSQPKVPPRPKPTLVVRYKCCWHCGPNMPAFSESVCEANPNSHMVPCNEPEDCEGKEVYLD